MYSPLWKITVFGGRLFWGGAFILAEMLCISIVFVLNRKNAGYVLCMYRSYLCCTCLHFAVHVRSKARSKARPVPEKEANSIVVLRGFYTIEHSTLNRCHLRMCRRSVLHAACRLLISGHAPHGPTAAAAAVAARFVCVFVSPLFSMSDDCVWENNAWWQCQNLSNWSVTFCKKFSPVALSCRFLGVTLWSGNRRGFSAEFPRIIPARLSASEMGSPAATPRLPRSLVVFDFDQTICDVDT